jgi:hypothetical protein
MIRQTNLTVLDADNLRDADPDTRNIAGGMYALHSVFYHTGEPWPLSGIYDWMTKIKHVYVPAFTRFVPAEDPLATHGKLTAMNHEELDSSVEVDHADEVYCFMYHEAPIGHDPCDHSDMYDWMKSHDQLWVPMANTFYSVKDDIWE